MCNAMLRNMLCQFASADGERIGNVIMTNNTAANSTQNHLDLSLLSARYEFPKSFFWKINPNHGIFRQTTSSWNSACNFSTALCYCLIMVLPPLHFTA